MSLSRGGTKPPPANSPSWISVEVENDTKGAMLSVRL